MTNPYISEWMVSGPDKNKFVEIRVDAGTDVSNLEVSFYDISGTFQQTVSLSSLTIVTTENGSDVYVIDDSIVNWEILANVQALSFYDGATQLQFISKDDPLTAIGGPDDGQISIQVGAVGGSNSLQSDDGGATYYVQSAPNPGTVPGAAPPCYAPGMMIHTPGGPRAVETLKPGDLVLTADAGPQPVLWVGSGSRHLQNCREEQRPVLIAAGAFGARVPVADLIVSPHHRILLGGHGQLEEIFTTQVMAPAKALTTLAGIRHMNGVRKFDWIHFALAAHHVVIANACHSESLLLGPMAVNAMSANDKNTLARLFGSAPPGKAMNGPPARRCLTVGQVRRRLTERRPPRLAVSRPDRLSVHG